MPCFSQNTTQKVRDLENEYRFSDVNQIKSAAGNPEYLDNREVILRPWLNGLYALYNSDFNKAYIELFEAYSQSKASPDELLTAEIALDLAKVYSIIELTGRSLSLLLEVEEIILSQGQYSQKARYFIQLGELQRRMANFEEGLTSLNKAELYVRDDQLLLCNLVNRKAAIYTEMSRHYEARQLSWQALRIAEKIGDPDLQAASYNELAFLGKYTSTEDSTFYFYSKADSLWSSIGRDRYAVVTRLALSIRYGEDSTMMDLSKSLEIAYSAAHLAKGKGWDFIDYDVYRHLSNLYLKLDKIDSALNYKIKSYDAHIRFLEKRNNLETLIVQAEYEQARSDELIREQQLKLVYEEQQNAAIRKQSTLYFFLMSVSLIVVLLLSVILRMNRAKRNKALEIANNEALVRKSLEQNLEEKNVLLAEVNHRVKNNLQMMSSLIDLQRLSEQSDLVRASLLESRRRIDAMGIIHEMLYANEFMNKVDIRMYVKHLMESEKMIFEGMYDNAHFVVDVDSIHLDMNQCINLGMVMSEFISNSFKHAFQSNSNPQINISIKQLGEEIELSISDNGRGISDEDISQNQSKSLGLRLITMFCKKLNGHHNLRGGDDGTELIVSFPIVKL